MKKKLLASGVIIFLSVFMTDLNYGYDFYFPSTMGFFLLIIILAILSCIVFLIEIIRGKLKYIFIFLTLTISIIAGLIASHLTVSKIFDPINQRRGEQIIEQIRAYKFENRVYPEKLDDLVPDYLSEIPLCSNLFYKNKFHYFLSKDRSHYYLSFNTMFGGIRQYSDHRNEWILTD